MKKIYAVIAALVLTVSMVCVISADASGPETARFQPADAGGNSFVEIRAEQDGESEESPDGTFDEPDGSGIPKDEPVSTTGTLYGYNGTFDLESALQMKVVWPEGEGDIFDQQLIFWGGPVIQTSGNASLAVHNSYIRGETAVKTAPLTGNNRNLLVAGNMRTTRAVENSELIFINSTIASRNRASITADGAAPAGEGQKQLSVYAYGSEAITMDGGYGAYSNLFCNLYLYGSHLQGAEIGMISATYGRAVFGTIADGEKDKIVSGVLADSDKDRRSDKELVSVIEGGRNALMICSSNLPEYWEFTGYSQEELPLLSANIRSRDTVLRTDLSLDKGVTYEAQKLAYINHCAGSVILIKSTNADLSFDGGEMIPDEKGTGYLIQTVCSNDTEYMNAVPDGKNYPGIFVTLNDMKLQGDIAHEDYQRDFSLTLSESELTGAVNEYDCAHWNQVSEQEGFSDYSPEDSYQTHHGFLFVLTDHTIWNVTQESHLSFLSIGPDCVVNGIITVDGAEVQNTPGTVYEGKVVVVPGVYEPQTVVQEETTEHIHNWVWNGGYAASCEAAGIEYLICPECGAETQTILPATGHNWVIEGGSPATCTTDSTTGWVCTDCEASYLEIHEGTALGHDWVLVSEQPGCVEKGYRVYSCSRCGELYEEYTEPLGGHDWVYDSSVTADCLNTGYDIYVCSRCGQTDYFNDIPATGHTYVIYPTPGEESLTHTYYCSTCGSSYTEPHTDGGGYCPLCGYSGAFGKID